MKKTYTYSLLQYHHSMVLGEVLNIGLLVYFSTVNKLIFIRPENLGRLKSAYSNFPEKTVNYYYEYFQERIDLLGKTPDIFYKYELNISLKEFVEMELLSADSSMLQFNNYTKAILYTNELGSLIKTLTQQYFPLDTFKIANEFELNGQMKNRKRNKGEWIKPDVKNKIAKMDKEFIFLPVQSEIP